MENYKKLFYDSKGNLLFDATKENVTYQVFNHSVYFFNENGDIVFTIDNSVSSLYNNGNDVIISDIDSTSTTDNLESVEDPSLNRKNVCNILDDVCGNGKFKKGLYTRSGKYQAYIPDDGIDENTTCFYYYHGAGSKSLSPAIKPSFDNQNTNAVAITISDTEKFHRYSVGTSNNNSINESLGINYDKTVFVGVSQAGKFITRDFADSIIEHPDVMNRRLVLCEPEKTYKLTSEQKNAIRSNGSLVFMVGRKGYLKYSGLRGLFNKKSDARCFTFTFKYKYKNQNTHGNNITNGLCDDFGLLDLLSGDSSRMERLINRIKEGKTITFKDLHGISYGTVKDVKVTMRYRGKNIKMSLETFMNYYLAIEAFKSDKNLTNRLNCLRTIYKIDGSIKDIPNVVKDYMKKMNFYIDNLNMNVHYTIENDVIGLSSIVEETVISYNKCVDNFKTIFKEYIKFGGVISDEHQDTDASLKNDSSIL